MRHGNENRCFATPYSATLRKTARRDFPAHEPQNAVRSYWRRPLDTGVRRAALK